MQRMKYLLTLSAIVLTLACAAAPATAAEIPTWLPQYDLDIKLDVHCRKVTVHERVTWTNRHQLPACELVMNVFPRYKVPKEDVVILAKTLELLRTAPSDAMDK